MSMMHHVCNSHEWACGKCQHDHIELPGEGREWLAAESPAAESLRDIIFCNRWLNSLQYYVRNRHTGGLEVHMSCWYVYMYVCQLLCCCVLFCI